MLHSKRKWNSRRMALASLKGPEISMPRLTVIGGSGFIGTSLCKRLSRQGLDFSIADKRPSPSFPDKTRLADVRSVEALREALSPGSLVINLAAEHKDNVRPLGLYDEVNVQGAKNVCAVAREKSVPTIVFTSSVAVYGFAKPGTGEAGAIAPFNDYGRTKYEAELVYRAWQAEDPGKRGLVIIRPTVVFGEGNRGNVYNLLRQISSGRFVMVGHGNNRKSMAYVENVAAFLEHASGLGPGIRTYNYIDKPDLTMNALVGLVRRMLGKPEKIRIRLPFAAGYAIGKCFDAAAALTGISPTVSSIRVKKFCADSVYETAIDGTGFRPPVPLMEALEKTLNYEFLEPHGNKALFDSE